MSRKKGKLKGLGTKRPGSIGEIIQRVGDILPLRVKNPFSAQYYMSIAYIMVLALGLHIFVSLKFAPEAGIALSRLIGAGGPGLFVALLEILFLAAAAHSFYHGYKLFDDKRLSFTYALYNISVTLPYINLMFIALASINPGETGITIKVSRLVIAVIYVVISLIIAGISSRAPFAIIEIYRAKRTGEFTLIDAPPGSTIKYDEGDMFRLIYTGRKDLGIPMLVLVKSSAWDIKKSGRDGRLEALFRPVAFIEDTLTLSLRGKPIYKIQLKPAKVKIYGKPDTEIHIELIVPTQGGKTIRKIIVERPGGVSLSKVLKDVIPSDLHIQRVLRIEKGRYVPVKDIDKEIIKPKTLNRFVVETLPAAKPAKHKPTQYPPKAKAKAEPGITASAPVEPSQTGPGITITSTGSELVDKVKRLIEEYTELREDLW